MECSGETATHSASMEAVKCQLNDTMSTPGARCVTGGISSMPLNSDLPDKECVQFRLFLSSQENSSAHAIHGKWPHTRQTCLRSGQQGVVKIERSGQNDIRQFS